MSGELLDALAANDAFFSAMDDMFIHTHQDYHELVRFFALTSTQKVQVYNAYSAETKMAAFYLTKYMDLAGV